jgi:hypothetical protein
MVSSHFVALLTFSVPRKEPLRHAGQSEQQERLWSLGEIGNAGPGDRRASLIGR